MNTDYYYFIRSIGDEKIKTVVKNITVHICHQHEGRIYGGHIHTAFSFSLICTI